jgi:hypothetical protein
MRAFATVALPHAALTGVDDTPSPHALSSAAAAIEQTSAKSRNADVGMEVSVEMNDGRDRASATAALWRKRCRDNSFDLLHASVVLESRWTTCNC